MKCKRCGTEYASDQFQKSELRPSRGSQWCRGCVREYKRIWKEKRRRTAGVPVQVIKYLQMQVGHDIFRCRKCNEDKSRVQFSKSNLQPRSRGWCRTCITEHVRKNGAGRLVWEKAQAKYKVSEKALNTLKLWRKTDKARMIFREAAARRRTVLQTCSVSRKQMREWYQRLYAIQRGTCAICKSVLTKYHVDHIQPLSKGGWHEPYNIQLLCPTCNKMKSDKNPMQFMQERGYLI